MAVALLLVAVATLAMTGSPVMQDVRQREAKPEGGKGKAARDTMAIKAQPVIEGDDSIQDSLLHTLANTAHHAHYSRRPLAGRR